MEELQMIGEQLLVLALMIYGLLLVVGAIHSGPKLANRYAKWLIALPFQMVSRLIFGKKKKRRRR